MNERRQEKRDCGNREEHAEHDKGKHSDYEERSGSAANQGLYGQESRVRR